MARVGAHIHVHQAVAWFEATNVVRRLVHIRLVNPREQACKPSFCTITLSGTESPVVSMMTMKVSIPSFASRSSGFISRIRIWW